MKVFSVITIFFLGLYLQGCAPRLDYGGPGTIVYQNLPQGMHLKPIWELGIPDQEQTIPNVRPIFQMVEDLHLDWQWDCLGNMVTYTGYRQGWSVCPIQGQRLRIEPRFIAVGIGSRHHAYLKPHEYQKLERFLLNILNPTPATSPAIREGR